MGKTMFFDESKRHRLFIFYRKYSFISLLEKISKMWYDMETKEKGERKWVKYY